MRLLSCKLPHANMPKAVRQCCTKAIWGWAFSAVAVAVAMFQLHSDLHSSNALCACSSELCWAVSHFALLPPCLCIICVQVRETQKTVRDGRTGTESMTLARGLGEQVGATAAVVYQ